MSKSFSKPDSRMHSDFKGVHRHSRDSTWYAAVDYIKKDGKRVTIHKGFKNEIDAALAYNKLAVKKYGLAARINTVPVPGLECVGNIMWELGLID